jgi:hypothetical protein
MVNGRDDEQIHGGNVRRVVMQKSAPSLAWRPTSLDHVFGDARLRDFKPELEQFAVDAWRTPKRILDIHPPDQCAQLRVWSCGRPPRVYTSNAVGAKAGPVPMRECLGPDDYENLQD